VIALALCSALLGGGPEPSEAEWVWVSRARPAGESGGLALRFDLDDDSPGVRRPQEGSPRRSVRSAALFAVVEHCDASVEVNGRVVAELTRFGPALTVDVAPDLRRGSNELVIHGRSADGPAAVALRLDVTFSAGSGIHLRTDARSGWRVLKAVDGEVVSFGPVVEPVWSRRTRDARVDAFDDYEQWRRSLGTKTGTDPAALVVQPGFEVELLRSARKDEGSWVSVTFDPRGRLLVGVEARGILRMSLPARGEEEIAVEKLASDLQEPRGLLWAHGSLYVNANNSKTLYRLRDTDGDDRFDERRALYRSAGGNGHGRNAIALGPQRRIHVIHGDSPDLPRDLADRTSPYREHRRGATTREGHVLRFDPDGSGGEIVAAGLRNPYGIDFNTDGEMFTYDADAEFDMGASWYRPTRVRHLVSGADYGWRGVTGSWPPYFPESPLSPPSTLDVGKGSPTGVRFGTASAFGPRYRRALFILDWAYGRILVVHSAPRGASYLCRAETFLVGRPLNVTDLVFGPDGAMYFVTGGRKTQSGLYRVRRTGPVVEEPPPGVQQAARRARSAKARALRRRLERHHIPGAGAAAIEEAWAQLSSADPWIRHAARLVLEHQPIADWEQRVVGELRPRARLTALLAIVRGREKDRLGDIPSLLSSTGLGRLSPEDLWVAIAVISTCLDRAASSKGAGLAGFAGLARELEPLYPSGSFELDRDLGRLLARLEVRSLVSRTLDLLDHTEAQHQVLHHLFVLRGVRHGWTPQGRERWAKHFRRTRAFLGGRGLPTFLQKMRTEFLAASDEPARPALERLLGDGEDGAGEAPSIVHRPFVREWTVEELAEGDTSDDGPPDPARGRRLFEEAKCSRCHRVRAEGAAHGPDLTSVSSRLGRRDLLRSILEPSVVVAPKYRSVTVVTRRGSAHTGRVLQGGDYRRSVLEIQTDPLDPGSVVKIHKADVLTRTPSSVSPMPAGLLDGLEREEILDLLAFLETGGRVRR